MTIEDGLGQSTLTDLVWQFRFRICRWRRIAWQKPAARHFAMWREDDRLQNFGDDLVAVAEIDGRRWLVVDRIWNGWPDPPEFAFFAVEPDGSVWAAADFYRWPKAWTIVEKGE